MHRWQRLWHCRLGPFSAFCLGGQEVILLTPCLSWDASTSGFLACSYICPSVAPLRVTSDFAVHPEGLVFSMPCRSNGDGDYEVIDDFFVDEWLREKMKVRR